MRTAHLLALAIDMPFMSDKYLRFLCDQIEPGSGVVPMIGDRAEPLSTIYPVEAAVDLNAALSGSDFSLQTVTNQLIKDGRLRVVSVAGKEKEFFRNLNRPAAMC
ncbi:MAG: molybdenum cofactor guanylyltransferase, partial [Pyrinomonadaceae bacterium]